MVADAAEDEAQTLARKRMVDTIVDISRETGDSGARSGIDARVLGVMNALPRHAFVPADEVSHAYENRPLPIGHGQTISQPYIVALMTDLLRVGAKSRVLEIGTGSGYQAAILAALGCRVHTIEIIPPLAEEAAQRLRRTGYADVTVKVGDGYYGWEEYAPFDAIVVTAAASHVPPPLVKQLKPGGRLVVPVGAQFQVQYLTLVEKQADGSVSARQLLPVRFVPLTGSH